MEFTEQEFMTAADKAKVLKHWERFMKALVTEYHEEEVDKYGNRMPKPFKAFTNELYKHLSLRASFIAHHDRGGFYREYFEEPEMTLKFMTQFDPTGPQISIEYGGSYWKNQYPDINEALIQVTGKYLPALREKLTASQKDKDVARAEALLRKHGMTLK